MDSYDIDALYSSLVDEFFTIRKRANATGGNNNIQAKGHGPEKAVRDWIASVVGNQYRVTEGHVVRADGKKSKQMDVIIVRDTPTATMFGRRDGEPELVRVECVAAVGEVKSSWYDHDRVIHSYVRMVKEIESLQEGLLTENGMRFGSIQRDTAVAEMTMPVTGRKWRNRCYTFMIALSLGKCNLRCLADHMEKVGIQPKDALALMLDDKVGGAICIPTRMSSQHSTVGVQCEVYRNKEDADASNRWVTLQETVADPRVASGRLLNLFLSDLQLHLSTSSWEFSDSRRYVKLSQSLRRRHRQEGNLLNLSS